MRPIWPRRARVLHHPVAHLQRQIANRHQVFVGLGREADHVVELQVLDAAREDQIGAIEDLVVGHGLVDDAAQAIGAGLRRDGDRALAALAQDADDRLGQIVEAQRGRADGVAHLVQPREDALDVRMVAERDRHEPDAARVRPRRVGELEDAVGRKRADGQVVVAGPAEAAQVRAAADDLDEEARAELGVGREDARRRRIDRVGRLQRRLSHRQRRVRRRRAPCTRPACRRRRTAARRTTGRRSRARWRAGAADRRGRSPRERRGAAPGTSTSPSPAAITSANGASGSGLTNVTAPPMTTSGWRGVRSAA